MVLEGPDGHLDIFPGEMLTQFRLRKVTSWGPSSPFTREFTFPNQVSLEDEFPMEKLGEILWLTIVVLLWVPATFLLCYSLSPMSNGVFKMFSTFIFHCSWYGVSPAMSHSKAI